MNDLWLPRIIVVGLLVALLATIAETVFTANPPQWTGYIITSIVSGLLGYIVSPGQFLAKPKL
jgi:tetrahydromethanopterin S-methyltransferase subunit C